MSRVFAIAGLVAFVVGVAVLAVGFILDPRRALVAYLVGWAFVLTTAVGSLVLVAIGHAARARWFVAVRRLAEIPAAALPLLLVLALPILLGAAEIYPWAGSLDALPLEERGLVEHKRAWLNVPFFAARTFVWLGLWSLLAWRLGAWSLRQDREASEELQLRMFRLSAGALPLLALSVTFASFDWLMSLEPTWLSTVYGVYVFSGGFVAALALVALVAALLPADAPVSAAHRYAVGKLLLAMVVFWAYIAFVQLMLVWIADLPREVRFYLRRSEQGWQHVSLALGLAHFVVPFFVLLLREAKIRPKWLAAVSVWLLGAHALDVYWLVVPPHARSPVIPWRELAAIAAIGGACSLFVAWRYRAHALFAAGDPEWEQAMRYRAS